MLLARDDIGFDAHADAKRCVVWQGDADAKSLGDGIAGRSDFLDEARQHLAPEGIGAQQRLLAECDPRHVLLVGLGHDPERPFETDAVENGTRFDHVADLAVLAQHDTVHGRDQLVIAQALRLRGDLGLDTCQIAGGFLLQLRRGGAAREQLRLPVEFLTIEILQRPKVVQGGKRLRVIEAREPLAFPDCLALTAAALDDAAAHEWRETRPCLGLDRSGGIDDFSGGAARRLGNGDDRSAQIPPADACGGGHEHHRSDQLPEPARRRWYGKRRRCLGCIEGTDLHVHGSRPLEKRRDTKRHAAPPHAATTSFAIRCRTSAGALRICSAVRAIPVMTLSCAGTLGKRATMPLIRIKFRGAGSAIVRTTGRFDEPDFAVA